jgi:hypothetical protein
VAASGVELRVTVTLRKLDEDGQWFHDHPDRTAHIREPIRQMEIDRRFGTRFTDECAGEFFSLGDHDRDRRRILLWKVPPDNVFYDPKKPAILKIPMLAFADESIEDRDDILLPIIDGIMRDNMRKL